MIKAKISSIKSNKKVSLIEFKIDQLNLFMLELGDFYDLKVGCDVELCIKSSDVVIATAPLQNCSLTNKIKVKIRYIQEGELMCILGLDASNFSFESIILKDSFCRLGLNLNDEIYAYIKATSVHISEIL